MNNITHSFTDTANRRIGKVMIVIALLLFFWTAYSSVLKWKFVKTAVVTTGEVISNESQPIISFKTLNGSLFTFEQDWRAKGRPKTGEIVRIVYSAENPENAEMVEYLWYGQLVKAFFGTFFLIIGIAAIKGYFVFGPLKEK